MYTISDDFRSCDENKQPYSFMAERHTEIANMHAWVQNEAFNMASIGNRFILHTPKFINGVFNMQFHVTYMGVFAIQFMVLFGYDEKTRTGQAIRFAYDLEKTVAFSLLQVSNNAVRVLESVDCTPIEPLREGESCELVLTMTDTCVTVCAAGAKASFQADMRPGKLAIERANFIGELVLEHICFTSSDSFRTNHIIPETTVQIPCVNGGDIPYRLNWKIDSVEGEYYLMVKLDGGCKTRAVDRDDRPGQYIAEKDWMTEPYVGLAAKKQKPCFYNLAQGVKAFIDPNIYWDCQKGFFGDTELPLEHIYQIPPQLICDELEIIFGYENLFCSGYGTQEGGCEFHFTTEGKLIYTGDTVDGRDIFELYSQADKAVLSLVPNDCYERGQVVEHLIYNHYFTVDEDMKFTFVMKTMLDTAYLSVKAEVWDVYESEMQGTYTPVISVLDWDYGYRQLQAKVCVPKMKIGVWKVAFCIYFGDKLYKRYVKVFEVLDPQSDVNPALASGLPFTFSMPNEQKRLVRNAFDLWNPMRSCDAEHYINCITDTPEEAQMRRSWQLSKPFKREWFVWISSRTCKDWSIDRFTDVVENCDYLFHSINEKVLDLSQSTLFPIRQDHYNYENFMMRKEERVAILEDFLRAHPDIAEKVTYKIGMPAFTYEHFVNLMQTCMHEWIAWQNAAGIQKIKAKNEELQQINPKVKRSVYGPVLNVYTTPTLSYHALNAYGCSDYKALAEDVYTGFAIFEDYPYSCSYQTYRGAFALMTILLHTKGLVVYPEQYAGSAGGCIDGAVKFAHAPMGAYSIEPYQSSTHAFEYVFNTAYRLPEGYRYWNTYGFHRSPGMLEDLVRDWKYVLDYKPARPLASTAFLAEYDSREDVFKEIRCNEADSKCYIMNQSESAHGLLYECSREAGLPNGFGLGYEGLLSLSAAECDLLVLPSLAYAKKEAIDKIRQLYYEGVSLIAVSDVTGLEDLFGVLPDAHQSKVTCVCYRGACEYVRENKACLAYRPNGATAVMTSDTGEPLIVKHERTVLLNTEVTNMGSADSQYMSIASTLHIVGQSVRTALCDMLTALSRPPAQGDNVGVTLFESEKGKCMLLAIDYTPFDNREHTEKEAVIHFNMDRLTNVTCGRNVFVGKKDGVVREIRFEILPHESVFVELQFD